MRKERIRKKQGGSTYGKADVVQPPPRILLEAPTHAQMQGKGEREERN